MTLDDVPAVMEIEHKSFPLAWPERAYRYEIAENPKAYFIVVRARPATSTGSTHEPSSTSESVTLPNTKPPHWFGRLFRRGQTGPQSASSSAETGAPVQGISLGQPSIAGYAGMWMMVDEAHIATIASHPQWRGCGVGELLLVNMLYEAQRQKAINATLEVRVSNTVAQRLYQKYEFEEVGRRKAYYQDNREDAYIYTITHFQTPEYAARLRALKRALMRRLEPG